MIRFLAFMNRLIFEVFQSMKDEPLRRCPRCGRLQLKRKVGAGAGLIFKGTGFYITDYKKKNGTPHKAESGGGDAKPSETPAKTESKSEAKPATKPAAK